MYVNPFGDGIVESFATIHTNPSCNEAVTVPELLNIKDADVPVFVAVSPVIILPLASGEFPFTVLTDAVNCVPLTIIPNPVRVTNDALKAYDELKA